MSPSPAARRDDVTETLHGVDVSDPYRWLEDADSAETAAFVAAQNAIAEPYLAGLAGREAYHAEVTDLLAASTRGTPFERGGRVFAWQNDGQNQDLLVTARDIDGLENDPQVLLDANTLSDDGTRAVTTFSLNQDGSLLAYGVADGGSDWRTLRVRDVATGEDLLDEIPWTKWNPPVWLPGGRAFTYWAYDAPTGNELTDEAGVGRLMAHEVGSDPASDRVLFHRPDEPRLFARVWPSDEEWFVLHTDNGSSSGNDLAVRRHGEESLRMLVDTRDDEWHAVGIRDGSLFVVTDAEAPRYRLVAIDLTTGTRRDILGEHDEDVLLDAALTASGIVATYSHDAAHRAQLFTFAGEPGDALPLGEGVSIVDVKTRDDSDRVFLGTTGFVDRGTRHVVDVAGARVVAHRAIPSPGPAIARVTTTRIRAVSTDGTSVPAFVVRADEPSEAASAPRPTLIWGYGGFNIAMNPEFRPMLAAWVLSGGTLVVPNLRGGGEFGSDWHRAGTKERKQQVFDDLYAIAEHLIATGVTTPAQLALHGRSNGGLLAGAALTQRPDLWAAVLPAVGVLDMLRYHRFTIGWAWASDYGDPDDADAFAYLRAYSPLHNVRPDADYPPTLITTGDHDDRVVPAHSFKFAAALQHAVGSHTAGPTGAGPTGAGPTNAGPILLSVDTRAGHGMGKPRDARAREFADQLAFAAHHTGLR
ncbi:prolyl oligopeptidase family serine peptidase [Microbacterium sp. bgisy203]|uniref:prolyl oligopeptidase family serine peptidase n=1 Tax=Microbacterium sp. bgisy203 TaxID=3413799 RepID=UPI003D752D19